MREFSEELFVLVIVLLKKIILLIITYLKNMILWEILIV